MDGITVEEVQADQLREGDRMWDYRNGTGESWQPVTHLGRDADDDGVLIDLAGGEEPDDRVYFRPEWKVLRLASVREETKG